MDEKVTDVKDQSENDLWYAELVEQTRDDKRAWRRFAIAMTIAFIVTNAYWIWTQNSYEYVYQDGSGQNNYNRDIGGDVNNVTTDQNQEEWKE